MPVLVPDYHPLDSIRDHNPTVMTIADNTTGKEHLAAPIKKTGPITADQVLQTFLELVKISSPSGHEEEMRAHLENRLQAMGFSKLDELQPDRAGYMVDPTGNVILRIPSNTGSAKTVLIDGHLDTVTPGMNIRPRIEIDPKLPGDGRVVYSAGDTVLGGDDKAALAPMLEALAYSLKEDTPRPNLIFAWTVQEEPGGLGAGKMDPRWYAKAPFRADVVLAFDINGEQGTVVYQAPQLTVWDAQFEGRGAHAGIEPEKGVNALKAALLGASKIKVGRLDADTTANIGVMKAGEKSNIVPAMAQMTGEVRSFNSKRVDEELKRVHAALEEGARQVPQAKLFFQPHTRIKSYKTDLNLPVFQPLRQAFADSNLAMKPIRTNGGSDANIFVQQGIPAVVLSGAYYNPHQTSEFVRVQDMATEANLLLNIWRAYATP